MLQAQDPTKVIRQKIASDDYQYEPKCAKRHGLNNFFGDFLVLLGSIFYPKDMRISLEAIKYKDAKTLVEIIHKTLYCYSNSNLHFLLQNSPAFRFILD